MAIVACDGSFHLLRAVAHPLSLSLSELHYPQILQTRMIVGLGVVGVVTMPWWLQRSGDSPSWWVVGDKAPGIVRRVVPGKSSLGWLIVVLAHVTHAFLLLLLCIRFDGWLLVLVGCCLWLVFWRFWFVSNFMYWYHNTYKKS